MDAVRFEKGIGADGRNGEVDDGLEEGLKFKAWCDWGGEWCVGGVFV